MHTCIKDLDMHIAISNRSHSNFIRKMQDTRSECEKNRNNWFAVVGICSIIAFVTVAVLPSFDLANINFGLNKHNNYSEKENKYKDNKEGNNETATSYLKDFLFDNNIKLISHFEDANDYIPLYNVDNFRRSRAVIGDVSRLRRLLKKLIVDKQCLRTLTIGGSVTVGHGLESKTDAWPYQLIYWLNNKYPHCSSSELSSMHIVDNKPIGSSGADVHFWYLSQKINMHKYDLIIMELASNSKGDVQDIWQEMVIRNLLLLDYKPCIVYLQATQSETQVLSIKGSQGTNKHGNLEQLIALNYYQIPTVSLSLVIYPLSYRYYLNGFMNENDSNITQALFSHHSYLFAAMKEKKENKDNQGLLYFWDANNHIIKIDRFVVMLQQIDMCSAAHPAYKNIPNIWLSFVNN